MPGTRSSSDFSETFMRFLSAVAEKSAAADAGERMVVVYRRVLKDSGSLADRVRTMLESVGNRHGKVTRMTDRDIERRLEEFERAYAGATGEELSSDAFYERFCDGEFDSHFGMLWASYFEAARITPELASGRGAAIA